MLEPSAASETVELSEIFDSAEVLDRACHDPELLGELAALFAENRDRLLDELNRAVADGDALGIGHAAHALKGSVATFTTKRPYRIARDLEQCGKDCRLEPAAQLLATLQADLVRLDAAVTELIATFH